MRRTPTWLVLAAALGLPAPAPAQVALEAGDVIVTDITLNAVYRVDPATGVRTTVATGGVLDTPRGVTVGPSGLLFVTESGNADAVVRIDPAQPTATNQVVVSTAGVFSSPRGIVIGPLGDLLVAEPNDDAIYRVHPTSGSQSIYATASSVAPDADTFHFPSDIALDAQHGLLVTDAPASTFKRLLRVPPGGGFPVELSQDQLFVFPRGVAVEAGGGIVVADSTARAVIRVHPVTGVQTSVSSGGGLIGPRGIAVETDGNILVADFDAKAVIRVHPVSGERTTLTTDPSLGPWGIAVVGSIEDFRAGDLLVADSGAGSVVRVTPTAPPPTVPWPYTPYASTLVVPVGSLAQPTALTRTRPGAPWFEAILVADGDAVRVIDTSGNVTTLAQGGWLADLTGIAVDADGDVLVTDSDNDAVVRIAPDGTQSLVGTTGGNLTDPGGLVIDRDGLLVVAARFSDATGARSRILRMNPVDGQRRVITEHLELQQVRALALDPSGDVLIANHEVLPPPSTATVGSVHRLDARFETLTQVAESVANSIESIQGVVSDTNYDVLVTNQSQSGTMPQTILRIDPLVDGVQPVIATGAPFVAIRGIALDAAPAAFPLADADGDLFGDSVDNCPLDADPAQFDSDADGQGDLCDPDDDNDEDPDTNDNCPFFPNADQLDNDGDGLGNACDNCDDVANPDQANNEGDLEGDVCDTDDDNDGILDTADNCTFVSNTTQVDSNQNGFGNLCDADFDDNRVVGIPDFGLLAASFGLTSGFDPDLDLDGTGAVGIGDFGIFSVRFGRAPGPSGYACAGSIPCPAP